MEPRITSVVLLNRDSINKYLYKRLGRVVDHTNLVNVSGVFLFHFGTLQQLAVVHHLDTFRVLFQEVSPFRSMSYSMSVESVHAVDVAVVSFQD